jgi:hypothetical protein
MNPKGAILLGDSPISKLHDPTLQEMADIAGLTDAIMGWGGGGGGGPWYSYTPNIDVWNNGAASPNMGAAPRQSGRYTVINNNLCIVSFLIQFGGAGQAAGKGNYIVSLPPNLPIANSSIFGNDRPMGVGYVAYGPGFFVPNILTFTIASDAFGKTFGGTPANWCQFLCQQTAYNGTGTINSGTTSTAVQFNGGAALGQTPLLSDISVAYNAGPCWVTGLSNTGFTVNVATAPGANTGFTWSCKSNVNNLVSDNYPLINLGSGVGDRVSGFLMYETI